jgi:hypothetical protein
MAWRHSECIPLCGTEGAELGEHLGEGGFTLLLVPGLEGVKRFDIHHYGH